MKPSLSKSNYTKLNFFIEKLGVLDHFGALLGLDKNNDGTTNFPYFTYDQVVDDFVTWLYDKSLIISFDWPAWEYGKEILDTKEISGLDEETLLKLLTMIIRSDRFSDGYLEYKLKDGTVLLILNELAKYEKT